MSTAPFRVAFWALGLACGFTFLLTALNPEQLREMHAQADQSQPTPTPMLAQHSGHGSVPSAVGQGTPNADQNSEHLPLQNPQDTESFQQPAISSGRPVQLASADPAPRLDLNPHRSLPQQSTGSFHAEDAGPQTAMEAAPAMNIPVPEPATTASSVNPRMGELREDLLQMQLEMLRREMLNQSEWVAAKQDAPDNAAILEELKSLRGSLAQLQGEPQPQDTRPTHQEDSESESVPEPAPEPSSTIKIQSWAGSTPESFTYRFREAPLSAALQHVADQMGCQIVAPLDHSLTYTGEFRDVTPEKAFALLIRTHSLTVNRRGTLILVAPASASPPAGTQR